MIRTDEDAVKAIDDLKYRLKQRDPDAQIVAALNAALDDLIGRFRLDGDPHTFASMPARAITRA